MQLKFEDLAYQKNAIGAIVDLFQGEPKHDAYHVSDVDMFSSIVANKLNLNHAEIEKNLHEIQAKFNQNQTELGQHGLNFSVEMETGTGKTYVYLRTIFELNQQYGWRKFVIVVPSVPIREGVLQTIKATQAHFENEFDKPIVNANMYSSDHLNILRNFAHNQNIEILIMNIDAFKKEDNVINRVNESGEAPILQINQTRPIVIIDEPQNMETDLAKQAIKSLNPLFVLRYSATHKQPYHKVYSLNPIEAYNQKLVKQIEVKSILAKNDVNGAYLALKDFETGKGSLKAKIELHFQTEKETKKKEIKVKANDDLFVKSGNNETYRNGFIINNLNSEDKTISFSNGMILTLGENDDFIRDEIMKNQITETIKEHLRKEKNLNPRGIKVLSLFFIDKVANYRNQGKFAQWFEEIYRNLTGESADGIHDGYFSQDKDTNGKTKADEETYNLIMKDKEKLLSFQSPLRFIFSHSALKEGWDNPNVFQICTLNETHSPIKKRQEIGRGLRLAVNQNGERVRDDSVNILTVIPNESYESFAANLQKEYENECGIQFSNGGLKKADDRVKQTFRHNFILDPHFQAIWEKIRHKTRYSVQFSRDDLIQNACEKIQNMPEIQKPQITVQKAQINQSQIDGIWGEQTNYQTLELNEINWEMPDILLGIQKKTQLTRQTIFEIIEQSGRMEELANNPQRFIDLMSEHILLALHELMVDGIEYFRLPENDDLDYAQSLVNWQNLAQNGAEFFKNHHTFEIKNPQKTIFDNLINLDSATENTFARDCENHEDVVLYFKLPNWFKIPTPIGNYNPDWAVVFHNREQIYFVAETKNTGKNIQNGVNLNKLDLEELQKIQCAKKHFNLLKNMDYVDYVDYKVVEKLNEL